jgi:hypothetical protein
MARKQHPADHVVRYFEEAPVTEAQTILSVCYSILKRRVDATTKRERRSGPITPVPKAAPHD